MRAEPRQDLGSVQMFGPETPTPLYRLEFLDITGTWWPHKNADFLTAEKAQEKGYRAARNPGYRVLDANGLVVSEHRAEQSPAAERTKDGRPGGGR